MERGGWPISASTACKALAALKGDDHTWAAAGGGADEIARRAAAGTPPEVFTFPHRTFQEYLAGAHLAAQTDLPGRPLAWSRRARLAGGHPARRGASWCTCHGDVDKPLALVASCARHESR